MVLELVVATSNLLQLVLESVNLVLHLRLGSLVRRQRLQQLRLIQRDRVILGVELHVLLLQVPVLADDLLDLLAQSRIDVGSFFVLAPHELKDLVVSLHQAVEDLNDLAHGALRDLHPVREILVELLFVPCGELRKEGRGDLALVLALLLVGSFGVEALEEDANVLVELVPVTIDSVEDRIVLRLSAFELVDSRPQLILCSFALFNTLDFGMEVGWRYSLEQ